MTENSEGGDDFAPGSKLAMMSSSIGEGRNSTEPSGFWNHCISEGSAFRSLHDDGIWRWPAQWDVQQKNTSHE